MKLYMCISAGTLAGLRANLKEAIETLTQVDCSVTSVSSGCELFLRFITLTALDHSVSWHLKYFHDTISVLP